VDEMSKDIRCYIY